MPIVSGPITRGGAVIDVQIGVGAVLRRVLAKRSQPVPKPVFVRAQIDTGSSLTGFAPWVFEQLSLSPVGSIEILTPSTRQDAPHVCNEYHVSLSIVANGALHHFSEPSVIAANGFRPGEGIDGLIGRDVLDLCGFQYWGPSRQFQFSF